MCEVPPLPASSFSPSPSSLSRLTSAHQSPSFSSSSSSSLFFLPTLPTDSVLPVCELERHSDDTQERSLQKQTLQSHLAFSPTVDERGLLLVLFLHPPRVFFVYFPQKAAMLQFYILLTVAGEYILTVLASAGGWGHASINASCNDSYLPFPLSLTSSSSSFLSQSTSKPTASCCQALATLSPTPADTRQMQTLWAGPCKKMVLKTTAPCTFRV